MPIIVTAPAVPAGKEQLVLDDPAVASNRVELDLHSGPILVRQEGPEWGDSELAPYLAQLDRGEIPVDFRLPNRKVTIPLMLQSQVGTSFNEARLQLQAKVGLLQREGGWLKRATSEGAAIYLDVVSASLKFGGGTHQALHELDIDVNLVLDTLPDWYGDEVELDAITETTAPEVTTTLREDDALAVIVGDLPGRVRIVVDEDDGDSQLGLLWGIRSRHYDSAATAALAYEAEAMTALDTAAIATISGASGGGSNNVVSHANLATSWTPVLSTQAVSAGAHKTHKGTYRVWARVYSTSGDDVQLRFVWDVGDLALPVENAPVRLPQTGSQFYLVDLGEIRLDQIPQGDHRWQGVIQAKGDAGGENVSIDRVYIVPVDEGYGVLRAPQSGEQGLADFEARDEFNQTAGALAGKTLPVGGTWSGVGDADDFAVETTGKTAQRATTSDSTTATLVGRLQFPSVPLTDTVVQTDFKWSTVAASVESSVAARYVDGNNFLQAAFSYSTAAGSALVNVYAAIGGSRTTLASAIVGSSLLANTWYTIRLYVGATGRCLLWVYPRGSSPGDPVLVSMSTALATGGALASGSPGLGDSNAGVTAVTRNYDNFAAWVPTPDAVLHPNQSAELRTDGMVREDSAGAAYGPVSHVIGDLPRLPPAGLESRTCELFLKASRGDLDQLPDTGIDDLSAQVFYRPSWLFIPSA